MVVLYLDFLPVFIFGLAAWYISQWVEHVHPDLTDFARLAAAVAFFSGFYKAGTLLLVRGYDVEIDFPAKNQLFFLILGLGYYYLTLCVYSVKQSLFRGEQFRPSRFLIILCPLILVLTLFLLGSVSGAGLFVRPFLISIMTLFNLLFVILSCQLALFLQDRFSALLVIASITLNFVMAGLAIFIPLENDFANTYYPNLIREIIFNTFAQIALLCAALRIRFALVNYLNTQRL